MFCVALNFQTPFVPSFFAWLVKEWFSQQRGKWGVELEWLGNALVGKEGEGGVSIIKNN